MNRLCHTITLAFVSAMCILGTAQAARVLPLRERGLFNALLQQPQPQFIKEVSLSPDGTHALAIVATPISGFRGRVDVDDISSDDGIAHWGIWLIDVSDGRREMLGGLLPQAKAYTLAAGTIISPQWSADSRSVALLQHKGSRYSLVVWNIAHPQSPARTIILPIFDLKYPTHWSWQERAQAVVIEGPNFETVNKAKTKTTQSSWAWIYSKDALRSKLLVTQRQNAVDWIDLRRGVVKRVRFPGNQAYFTGFSWPYTSWKHDRDGVLFSLRDKRAEDPWGQPMGLIKAGAPAGRDLRNMRSTLLHMVSGPSVMQTLYQGGPGEIGAATKLPGNAGYAVLEEVPQFSVWPMRASFGQLRVVNPQGARTDVPTGPLLEELTSLFAASDASSIYAWEEYAPEQPLWKINVNTGVRERLNPPGLAASSVDVSADGRTIVAVLEAVDRPPQVAVWQEGLHTWRFLTDFKTTQTLRAPRVQWIQWKSHVDHLGMNGILTDPVGFDGSKPAPLLVCITGGQPYAKEVNFNHYNTTLALDNGCGAPTWILADAGYAVFTPNHRGTESIGYQASLALGGHFGDEVTLDIDAGVDELIARGIADPEHLGILGHSDGGREVAFAISHSNRYRAAVIDDSPIALPEAYLAHADNLALVNPEYFPRTQFEQIVGYDPLQRSFASPFTVYTPLLLRWSGLLDDTKSFSDFKLADNAINTEDMRQTTYLYRYALSRNGVPFDVIIDRDAHVLSTPKYVLEYQSRLLQWLDFFILGRGENPIPAMVSPLDYTRELHTKSAK